MATMSGSKRDDVFPAGGVGVVEEADRVVLQLWGEHDLASVPALEDAFSSAAEATEADVVIDLRTVEFLDMSTLRTILQMRSALAAHARRVVVRSPSGFIARIFVLCNLVDLLEGRAEGQHWNSANTTLPSRE